MRESNNWTPLLQSQKAPQESISNSPYKTWLYKGESWRTYRNKVFSEEGEHNPYYCTQANTAK